LLLIGLLPQNLLNFFPGGEGAYRQFVDDSLSSEVESPMTKVVASTILGGLILWKRSPSTNCPHRKADHPFGLTPLLSHSFTAGITDRSASCFPALAG